MLLSSFALHAAPAGFRAAATIPSAMPPGPSYSTRPLLMA